MAAALFIFGGLCFEFGARYALASRVRDNTSGVVTPTAVELPREDSTEKVAVYVTGAVRNPGVYWLDPSERVQAAVLLAQPTASAALSSVNLAQHVEDEMVVIVPSVAEAAQAIPGQDIAFGHSKLVNINTADQKTLESLPGIGPTLASRIIDYREKNGPFSQVDEIMKVDGIGQKRYADIKDLITVR